MNVSDFGDREKLNARELIAGIYNVELDEHDGVVFYTPTHRDHLIKARRPMLFSCDYPLLNQLLLNSGVFLFVRKHGITSSDVNEKYSNIIYTADKEYVDFHKLAPGLDYRLFRNFSGIFTYQY